MCSWQRLTQPTPQPPVQVVEPDVPELQLVAVRPAWVRSALPTAL